MSIPTKMVTHLTIAVFVKIIAIAALKRMQEHSKLIFSWKTLMFCTNYAQTAVNSQSRNTTGQLVITSEAALFPFLVHKPMK